MLSGFCGDSSRYHQTRSIRGALTGSVAAADGHGIIRHLNPVDQAATRFLCKAIKLNDDPIKINIDKSGANTAAINDYNDDEGTDIEIRQNKYLNNMIEQDHRPIKQLCRATLGFKSFKSAKIAIGGFESMRIIRKRQVKAEGNTSAEIFYSMAA
jgi:hypothetical protein